jgi:hypothetical protein
MNKAVSFGLWGHNPMYDVGAIKNIELHKKYYVDWDFVIHYDNTVPVQYINQLKNMDCILINNTGSLISQMFWRFLSYSDYDVTIFRDCDSRISLREELAVNEWLESGKRIHVMRDHPAQIIPYPCNKPGILGGMWGIINKPDFDLIGKINDFHNGKLILNPYGQDQLFLMSEIYDVFKDECYIHDEFHSGNKFPIERENYHFIGERFNEFNQRHNDYLSLVKK